LNSNADLTLDVRTFETLSESTSARTIWDNLFSRSVDKTVFLLAGWLDAWHKTIGKDQPLSIVVISQQELPVLAGAFSTISNKIVFAGAGPSDYSQLLIDKQFAASNKLGMAIDLLLDTVRQTLPSAGWFRLGMIPVASPTFQALSTGAGRFQGVATTSVVAPHMSMSLAPAALKKKSLRRHENKLKRRGTLSINTHTDSEQVEPLLPVFFDQHIRRWSKTGVESQFKDQQQCRFISACCKELAQAGVLRFTEIKSNDEAVAFHLGFCCEGVYTWYKPTFEPDLSEYSPGEVLLKALIQSALDENAEIFDFTIGNETFKHRFADHYPDVSYLNVSDSTAMRALFRSRNLIRRLRSRKSEH